MPTLLRSEGARLAALAFLPLVGLPWVLKFLWATRVDNLWSARLGRRRSWVLPMQALVLLCLAAAAALGISLQTAPAIVALAALGSLASATQDIATDGLVAEHFEGRGLAGANALQVGGTMVGFFVGGAGSMVLTGLLGQRLALAALCLPVACSLVLVALWREPAAPQGLRRLPGVRQPRASLKAFVRRPGAWLLVAAAVLSSITAVSGFGLAKLFLVDAGWPVQAVGRVGMAGGAVTVLLGCGGGAWLVARLGARLALAWGLAACAASALAWMALAVGLLALDMGSALAAQALGAFGTGASSVAVMTLAMRFAGAGEQAGTDMTAVQSARDTGEILASSMVTSLAAAIGYGGGFAAGLLAAAVTLAVGWRMPGRQDEAVPGES
jgi:RhtX/FptX family siderophore transporter